MNTEFNQVQWHDVVSEEAGQRIDNFLIARLRGVPKSLVYRILRKGEVRVNKKRTKPDYKIKAGVKRSDGTSMCQEITIAKTYVQELADFCIT